jgi:uncharacterized membrane protein
MHVCDHKWLKSIGLSLFALLVQISPRVNAAMFTGLGILPNYDQSGSFPYPAISADGSVVVGVNGPDIRFETNQAFRWTMESGMEGLGFPEAFDVSSDGTVVVGGSLLGPGRLEALRWTPESRQRIGVGMLSRATGVSDDGSVVVGVIYHGPAVVGPDAEPEPFRWTSDDGLVPFGFPGNTWAVSGDGRVVVGSSSSSAYRWTEEEGLGSLGYLPGHNQSRATDTSADGSVIVGVSGSPGQPFRWTAETGMAPLNGWDSARFGSAQGVSVSSDGSTIVGYSGTQFNPPPFIWNEQSGVSNLVEVLISEYGLAEQLKGWSGLSATDISGNAQRIVGHGTNPSGKHEAWIAILDSPIAAISGDYNGNGTVEQADLDLVLLHWGNDASEAPASWINNLPKGTIDQDELDGVLLNWGNTAPTAGIATAAVPEPSGVWLAGLLAAVALAVVRRSR